jgi:hypothetical protein
MLLLIVAVFPAVMIVISVFVAVLSSNPKSPISERRAITGALYARTIKS